MIYMIIQENLARTFLEIASKILPGISRLKGKTQINLKHIHTGYGSFVRICIV